MDLSPDVLGSLDETCTDGGKTLTTEQTTSTDLSCGDVPLDVEEDVALLQLLGQDIKNKWVKSKLYVLSEPLLRELGWFQSYKNEKKKVPHLEKKIGSDLSYPYAYQSKQFISIMALMKLARTWKAGSKVKRLALLDEIPSAIKNIAFKYKTQALSETEPQIKCNQSMDSVQNYLDENVPRKVAVQAALNIYKQECSVTPKDAMYLEQNVSGTRLFETLRKKILV